MFPFSAVHNPKFNELIDYIMPKDSGKLKKHNYALSKLSQLLSFTKVKERKKDDERFIRISSSIKEITRVLQNLDNNIPLTDEKAMEECLKKMQREMVVYYGEYIKCLINYFSDIQKQNLFEKYQELTKNAITKLGNVANKIETFNSGKENFENIVGALQSPSNFKENAHKLVHSEDILFYCVLQGKIKLPANGIRFFTRFDMCDMCESITMKYANITGADFIVLSKEKYYNSRERDNDEENVRLKKYAIPEH